jgi:hypothetical protein
MQATLQNRISSSVSRSGRLNQPSVAPPIGSLTLKFNFKTRCEALRAFFASDLRSRLTDWRTRKQNEQKKRTEEKNEVKTVGETPLIAF